MGYYSVKEVQTAQEFEEFYRFQNKLFSDNAAYVPSLDSDQKKSLSQSPCLEYCKQKLLLAYDPYGNVVGRCCAIINMRYNIIHNCHRMRFGWTDFIDDYEVFKLLMDTAIEWGRSEGMTEIHGPLGYNTMYKQGMVVEGFGNMPQSNNLFNAPYYPEYVEKYGFVKEADWLQYIFDGQTGVPERLERLSRAVLQRYGLKIVKARRFCRRKGAVEKFFKQYNTGFLSVMNFIPFTDKEIEMEGKEYVRQLRNSLSCIVVDSEGEVAAFAISLPNISNGLKKAAGSLFPWGWYHIMIDRFRCRDVDLMLVGSNPKYDGKGVSAILHCYLARKFKKNHVRFCITNPQYEDNPAIKVWDEYPDKKLYIRRRCYIKEI
ncbi:MAG: hypothetical protein KBT00_06445 [Bacteroidales bacterium]|nr:hypothetical protein [Candidatus Cacconaster merdequi]